MARNRDTGGGKGEAGGNGGFLSTNQNARHLILLSVDRLSRVEDYFPHVIRILEFSFARSSMDGR